jgi:TDG/mug DNA glycosylase family protein
MSAAEGLPDIIAPNLKVLFCGINPGMKAAAHGHHFVGRNNRFWRVLHLAGFTEVQFSPEDDRSILSLGYGLTTVVERPTQSAKELNAAEFTQIAKRFEQKIRRTKPRYVAFLGKAAYSGLTGQKKVEWGLQASCFGDSLVWVLPNPSGLNRGFSLEELVNAYRELRGALEH